ncbi:MAG TPA: hypothetical protein VK402_15250 [Blastococcus sp.]|nr:hypothetical protein [Blastococcus sp.]
MEFALFLVAVSMQPLALVAAVLPPVAMAVGRRRLVLSGLLYLATLAMVAAWFFAMDANMDWADSTGGGGSAFAGVGWFLGALVAAAAATAAPVTGGWSARAT